MNNIPSVYVVSYGGSGTNLLAEYLHRYRTTITPLWQESLCHLPIPINFGVPTIVLAANPRQAYQSQLDRGLERINARKMGGNHLKYCMETFLSNWIPVTWALQIRYEDLWDRLDDIERLTGIPMAYFPKRVDRRSAPTSEIGFSWLERLYGDFGVKHEAGAPRPGKTH